MAGNWEPVSEAELPARLRGKQARVRQPKAGREMRPLTACKRGEHDYQFLMHSTFSGTDIWTCVNCHGVRFEHSVPANPFPLHA